MKVHILSEQCSAGSRFLAELRDVNIQQDRLRFRKNLERLGELMAYEFSKTLDAKAKNVQTPLGSLSMELPEEDLVLVTVMRAGIPFFQGFLNIFDRAAAGFIGAYREEGDQPSASIDIALTYSAMPNLDGRILVLVDPMLATGQSLVQAFERSLKYGTPKAVHFMSVICAPEGLDYVTTSIDHPGSIWSWARDQRLDESAYIVPGLGDAGDLCFGPKE